MAVKFLSNHIYILKNKYNFKIKYNFFASSNVEKKINLNQSKQDLSNLQLWYNPQNIKK